MQDTYVNAERLNYFKNKVDEKIEADLSPKADKTGLYPDLTAGSANQLIGTVYTEDKAPYKFRTTGGSADVGNRADDTIVGGSIVWNQNLQGDFSNSANWIDISDRTTHTITNEVLTVTIASSDSGDRGIRFNKYALVADHTYIARGYVNSSSATSVCLGVTSPSGGAVISPKTLAVTPNTLTAYEHTFKVGAPTATVTFIYIDISEQQAVGDTVELSKWQLFDLTQMFGPTIADYIYSLEQATAGAGVAWFRKLFPDDYYAYNTGEIISVSGLTSHDTVGFNLWDEEWEIGTISTQTGANVSATGKVRSKNYIPVLPSTEYHLSGTSSTTTTIVDYLYYYDADQNFIDRLFYSHAATVNKTFTTPSNAHYMRFIIKDDTNPGDICINLSWSGYRNGEYEPYVKHSYPLDSTLTLRGIPKLDANNNLYYDGDTYESDGTVTRKYGVVDLGTLNWSKYGADDTNYSFFVAVPSDAKPIVSNNDLFSGVVTKYAVQSFRSISLWKEKDKAICQVGEPNRFIVRDSSYTDAATFKTAMSGVYLVYELATPTTESAAPYTNPQIVDDFGTEEYVTDSIVPVGHVTKYPENLRDKLQHLPDLASTDGSYLLTQSNKKMSLSPYVAPTIPPFPTPDTTLSVEGGYAEAKTVGDEISGLKEDLEPLQIIAPLDTNYSTHDISPLGRSLEVVGNSFATSVKIANGSPHIPSAEYYKNDTNSGIVVKPTGNGVNMDGTFTPASGRRLVTSNPLLPNDLAGKTVVLRVIADKPITFTNGAGLVPEFQLLINGAKKFGITLPVNEQVTLDLTKEFSYTASQAGKPYTLVFANLQQGTDFDDVNVVFLMYDSETTVYDTETILTDGETRSFDIPSGCVDVIDTGVHQSKYYGVVNTKNYVDNNIPPGVITNTDLPYVTPQMYGAMGDGVTDDTISLQTFLNSAFDNNKIAFIPSGTYLHTGIIFPAKTSQTDAFVPTIRGVDKSSVVLKHTGSGVGVTVAPRTGTANINGVTISDMTLTGNASTTIGLKLSDGYYMDIQNVVVNGASQSCVEMNSVWLSNFRNIYCTPDSATGSGFLMTGGNCQHNTIDLIFVRNTKNIGMKLAGGTTMIGNLACDNASGEYAYVINGFKGTIAGLGCENPTTETVVSFSMSQCFVADAGFSNYQPPEENYKGYAINIASSNVQIQNLKTFLGASAERQTCEGALFNIYYGHVTVNQMEGQQTFEKLINDAGFSNYDTLTLNDRSSSCISIRKRYERPYIGTDKRGIDKEVTGDALFDKSLFGNAIYLNCTGEARYKSDGTDCTANNPVYNGDWFIESDPSTYNVAGYVIRNNCTTLTKSNSEERPIPLIIYGATANRPTHPFTGMMFFDTTLGKPIWYNGSAWVDATGTSVT